MTSTEQGSSKGLNLKNKELLLTFDPTLGLDDLWVSSPVFFLLNKLRSDMARRQNYGRGLPIQLSRGYHSAPLTDIQFDIDSAATAAPSKLEEERNLFAELELAELLQLSAKYGHESSNLRFCHHCKQFKRKVIFAKCNYSSTRHKTIYAPSVQVNGVKIYNCEGHLSKKMDCLTLKKLVKDKKRRKACEEQL